MDGESSQDKTVVAQEDCKQSVNEVDGESNRDKTVVVQEDCKNSVIDVDQLLEKFQNGWNYPHRPIQYNTQYPYKLLHADTPDDITLRIEDRVSSRIQMKLQGALAQFKGFIREGGFAPIARPKLKEGMPVAVLDDKGNFHRGELNNVPVYSGVLGRVNVTYVDDGEDEWIDPEQIYSLSIDLLRLPKLAMPCRLAQVGPTEDDKQWPVKDYRKYLEGKERSIMEVVAFANGIHQVHLNCDNIDVGLNLVMNNGLADYISLDFVKKTKEEGKYGKYPLNDYSPWVGQTLSVFGTKVVKTRKNGAIKIHLQLDTSMLEKFENELKPEVKSDLDAGEGTNFVKEDGDAVLVLYEDLKYRATIYGKCDTGYTVKLVDYGDVVTLKEDQIYKIPEEYVDIPEGATPCFLAELLVVDRSEQTEDLRLKLEKLVSEQNLYCKIGLANFRDLEDPCERRKCFVTLTTDDGQDFVDLLGLQKLGLAQRYVHKFPGIHADLAPHLFTGVAPYFPCVKYTGAVACFQDYNSVYFHLEDDDTRAEEVSEELTRFYLNYAECPEFDSDSLVGTYVAAQQVSDDDDLRYYRAKVVGSPSPDKFTVQFLDHGNFDIVPIDKLRPLPGYFGMEKKFAVETVLPIDKLADVDGIVLYDFINNFIEGVDLDLYLQNEEGCNYVWIFYKGKSLAHELVSAGLASIKITPAQGIPSL